MRLAAHRALAVGITTIRDLGDRGYLSLKIRDWFLAGNEVGPRIVASGPPITTVNGHCWFLGGEIDGIDAMRQAVREHVADGVDVIKVMASGGNMTPTVGPHESQLGSSRAPRWRSRKHNARAPARRARARRPRMEALSPSVPTRSSTAPSSAPTASTPAPRSSNTRDESLCHLDDRGGRCPVPPGSIRLYATARRHHRHHALYRAGAGIVCSSDAGVGPNKPHTALPYGVTTFLSSIGMTRRCDRQLPLRRRGLRHRRSDRHPRSRQGRRHPRRRRQPARRHHRHSRRRRRLRPRRNSTDADLAPVPRRRASPARAMTGRSHGSDYSRGFVHPGAWSPRAGSAARRSFVAICCVRFQGSSATLFMAPPSCRLNRGAVIRCASAVLEARSRLLARSPRQRPRQDSNLRPAD